MRRRRRPSFHSPRGEISRNATEADARRDFNLGFSFPRRGREVGAPSGRRRSKEDVKVFLPSSKMVEEEGRRRMRRVGRLKAA